MAPMDIPRGRVVAERAHRRSVTASVAAVAFLAAAAAAAVFIPWGDRYEAVYYEAAETSTTARYPHGFLLTGALEGAALVLLTATALLAITAAVAGDRIRMLRARALAFTVVAALLAATILPAAVLYGFLAAVPAIATIVAVALAAGADHRPPPRAVRSH